MNYADKMFDKIETIFDKTENRIDNELDEKHDKPFRIFILILYHEFFFF